MTHAPIEDILPLSPLQEGLLFHSLHDETDVYTVQLSFTLEGAVNPATLRAAAKAAVNRHANLRVSMRHQDVDQPVQVVRPQVKVPWRQVDLSRREAAEAEEEFGRLIDEDRITRFDLASAPLLRFMLVRIAPDRFRLVVTFHHILVDGWSLPVFLTEFFTLYANGADLSALPPAVPYRRYLSWFENQDREAALATWSEALAGLEAPTLVAPGHATVGIPRRVEHVLSVEATRRMASVVRSRGLTMNTLIQGAWATVLGVLTGRDDVVFGTVVSGRPAEVAGSESMVGLFANTVPVRVRLDPSLTLSDFLAGIHERQSELMDCHYTPLSEIIRSVNVGGTGELFDTIAVFENYPVEAPANDASVGGLRVTAVQGRDAAHFPLMLTAMPGERLRLAVDYQADAFDRATAERIAERVASLLESMVASPDQVLGRIDVLSETEREQLASWNDTAVEVPVGTVGEVFGRQAGITPDAVAVVSGEEQISYAELEARANRLAHLLIEQGVGPERVVALSMPRGVDMITAVLGVLKAGGAYLPVDPTYPAERRQFMLDDAQPVLVLDALPDTTAYPSTCPVVAVRPDNAAYVIYTSGSTGRPKGVVARQADVVGLALDPRFEGSGFSRVLVHSPQAFDAATFEMWVPLLRGNTAV
ncbi:condensation domain-containing protein, partial [Streptomyces yangpuensis]|uniref:condensation domain-containing protein n=1 Tax=Streptomyces yangpuensis TaxID=1648182 RepID=UPI0038014F5D